jgi:Ca2+-binding EF-hand superfamily protein
MRHRLGFVLLLLSVGASAETLPPAQPDEALRQEWEARFRAADKNGDGRLDRAEAEAGLPKVLFRHFDRIDLDGDGYLTPEELWAMHEREVAERERRRTARVQAGPPR